MMHRLKNIITRAKDSAPFIYNLAFMFWSRRNFHFNRKKIRGHNNIIENNGGVLNGVAFDINGDGNRVKIGSMAALDNVTFHIQGNSNNVVIGSDCRIANSSIWIEDNYSEINIGEKTTIGGAHLAATEDRSKIHIGNDCMLAYGIEIRTGDSHGIYDKNGKRINAAQDILIGHHVWIGTNVSILKGSNIGAGSIVGTGSIASKCEFPENSIVAGNPAMVVKENIQWTRHRGESANAI